MIPGGPPPQWRLVPVDALLAPALASRGVEVGGVGGKACRREEEGAPPGGFSHAASKRRVGRELRECPGELRHARRDEALDSVGHEIANAADVEGRDRKARG